MEKMMGTENVLLDSDIEQRDVSDWLAEHQAKWDAMTPEEQEEQRAKNLAEQKAWEEKNAGKSIEQIMGESIAEELGKPGWLYGDLPKLTKEYFDKFIDIIGEENIHWITLAQYPANFAFLNNEEPLYRGQYLVSPEGQKRGKKYVDSLQ